MIHPTHEIELLPPHRAGEADGKCIRCDARFIFNGGHGNISEPCPATRPARATGGHPQRNGDFSIGGPLWPGISKLVEEMGEVGQVAGKLIGSEGRVDHFDGTNLRDRLHEERGDLKAAIAFVEVMNSLDEQRIDARMARKFDKFMGWHRDRMSARAVATMEAGRG